MNKVILNPENYELKYLEHLNFCFPNWGQMEQYDWAFTRSVGNHESDILLLTNEHDEVIAGSGITYRTIKTKQGNVLNIGTFTGSWTLPQARGRGCFSQIIQEFLNLCKEKGVDYLTAFVTESNASYRRFESIGSHTLQADNILSNQSIEYQTSNIPVKSVEINPDLLFDNYCDFSNHNGGYFYTKEEFLGQYINRNQEVYSVQLENNIFLIEENDTTVRILYYTVFNLEHLKVLSNWANNTKSKKIMFFLTDSSQIESCATNEFNIIKSFFTIDKTSDRKSTIDVDFEDFRITLADKM